MVVLKKVGSGCTSLNLKNGTPLTDYWLLSRVLEVQILQKNPRAYRNQQCQTTIFYIPSCKRANNCHTIPRLLTDKMKLKRNTSLTEERR